MANSDLFTQVGNPGSATTLAAPGHAIGTTTFNVISTANWPTVTSAIFAVDTGTLQTVNGVPNVFVRNPGSYTEWQGDVTGSTTIANAVLRFGTDQNYPAGTLTRVYIPVSSSRENRLAQGIAVGHNQADGTHKPFTESNIVPTTAIQDSAVTTVKIALNAVTAAKLDAGAITLDSKKNSSTQTGISTTDILVTGLTSTITVPSVGREVEITGFVPGVSNNVQAGAFLTLWNSATPTGTVLQTAQFYLSTTGTGNSMSIYWKGPLTGSQSFCLSLRTNIGSLTSSAGTTAIAYLTIKLS